MSVDQDCPLCGRTADAPPGGWVYVDNDWLIGVLPAAAVPGWLVLQPRAHVEALSGLSASALARFGGLVAEVASALTDATGAARVYLAAFGERIPHWHLLLAVPPSDLPHPRRGPTLLTDFADFIDTQSAADVARDVALRLEETRHE